MFGSVARVCSACVRISAVLISVLISKPASRNRISSLSYASPKVPDCSRRCLFATTPYTGSTGVNDTFRFDGVFIDGGDTGFRCSGCWWDMVGETSGELVELGCARLSTVL